MHYKILFTCFLYSVYATSSTSALAFWLSLTCSLCFLSPLEQLPHSSPWSPENRARMRDSSPPAACSLSQLWVNLTTTQTKKYRGADHSQRRWERGGGGAGNPQGPILLRVNKRLELIWEKPSVMCAQVGGFNQLRMKSDKRANKQHPNWTDC